MHQRLQVLVRHLSPAGSVPLDDPAHDSVVTWSSCAASRITTSSEASIHVYDCPRCSERNAAKIVFGIPYQQRECHFCFQRVCVKHPQVHYFDTVLSLILSPLPFVGAVNELRQGLTERKLSSVIKGCLSLMGDAVVSSAPLSWRAAASALQRLLDASGDASEMLEALMEDDRTAALCSGANAMLQLYTAKLERQLSNTENTVSLPNLVSIAGSGLGVQRPMAHMGMSKLEAQQMSLHSLVNSKLASNFRRWDKLDTLENVGCGMDIASTGLQEYLRHKEATCLADAKTLEIINALPQRCFLLRHEASQVCGREAIQGSIDAAYKAAIISTRQKEYLQKALQTLGHTCNLSGMNSKTFTKVAQKLYNTRSVLIAETSNL